jgi:hypothetical protein
MVEIFCRFIHDQREESISAKMEEFHFFAKPEKVAYPKGGQGINASGFFVLIAQLYWFLCYWE